MDDRKALPELGVTSKTSCSFELFLDNITTRIDMTLEDEMQHEIARLKKEIESIDSQMEKLNSKIFHLLELKNKDEHDLHALQGSLEENYIHQVEQESLKKILGRKKIRA